MKEIIAFFYTPFSFKNPEAFWLCFLFIPIIVWYILQHNKKYPHIRVSTMQHFNSAPVSWMQHFAHSLIVLRIIALFFIIVALARPFTYNTYNDSEVYGVDIMLAMDVSSSMLAQDLQPDRITASIDVASKFITNRQKDRIGIVVFSGESFTQAPLTTDHASLLNVMSELEPGIIEDGTAIGMGIGLSVSRLKESKAKSKVIVLLTDGVNNAGDIDPYTAAELAAKYNIRIYTIGVGTRGLAPSPALDMFGNITMQMMEVEIDEAMLSRVAELTGGAYFRATNKAELITIYNKIDALEKTKIDEFTISNTTEEFWMFLSIALCVFALEFLLQQIVFKRFP